MKKNNLQDIHSIALQEFDQIIDKVYDEREQCLQDRRFCTIAGAQWEGDLGQQFENKPRFEVNKIHLSIIRIINEYRNNRITVNFLNKEGNENDKLADLADGLYRADEDRSVANEAYDNAFEEAVTGGFGAWRLITCYENEGDLEDEKQRINIEPIFDADSTVFFDLNAKRQDKSDARCCFVLTGIERNYYEEQWDDCIDSWDRDITESEFDWVSDDVVYLAEYYKIEENKTVFFTYKYLDEKEERFKEEELDEDLLEHLNAVGAKEIRRRNVIEKKVRKYILSGGKVLEDCGYIAGNSIPIVPVYGKRWYVDNIERCMGHVRLAKDAQRLKNMQLSKLGEISALSPVQKPIVFPEQIVGFENEWADDSIENYAFLRINPMKDINGQPIINGPVAYTKHPDIPPAMAALLQITENDMQDILGNQQQGEQITGNIAQGTMELIQNRLDMQTYIYMSNMAKAVKRCGEIWLGIAKDVFIEEGRVLRTLGTQGEIDKITLLEPVINKKEQVVLNNDLSKANLDLTVSIGPSSSTKRAATVRALSNMLAISDDSETKQVLSAMIMMNMEGEGIIEARKYFRNKLLKMGVVKPTDLEKEELAKEAANQQPTPQDEYLRAAAQKELTEAAENQANVILKQAQADKTKAEAVETVVDTDIKQGDQALEVIDRLNPNVTIDTNI